MAKTKRRPRRVPEAIADSDADIKPINHRDVARFLKEHPRTTIPYAEVIVVTPELAHYLLTNNTRNRRLSDQRVAQYQYAMENGMWLYTGESICLSPTLELLNGQHRLTALIQAGVSLSLSLSFNVPSDAFVAMDQHAARNFGDALSIQGENQVCQRSAIVRIIWQYEHSNPRGKADNKIRPDTVELLQYHQTHPTADGLLSEPYLHSLRKLGVPLSDLGLIHYAFERSGSSNEQRDTFFEVMAGEQAAKADHPARCYVQKRLLLKTQRITLRVNDRIAVATRVFNAFQEGRGLKRLHLDNRIITPSFEGFPRGQQYVKSRRKPGA